MSKITIAPNASGTAVFTVAAPATNTDRTLTLPDATGTVNISGLANQVPSGSVSAPSIYPTGNANTGIYFPATNTIAVSNNGAETMRVNATGDLLVGTTDLSGSSGPGFKLSTNGTTLYMVTAASTGTNNYHFYSTGASAYRFYVGSEGRVNCTNTTIAAISDIRMKENIRDIDAGLAEIMALKPRIFDWKEGKGKNIKGDKGWIAQEFEQVFPEMIGTWLDTPPEGEEPYKSVGADLFPVLVKAIQEQQAIIVALEARITELEAK